MFLDRQLYSRKMLSIWGDEKRMQKYKATYWQIHEHTNRRKNYLTKFNHQMSNFYGLPKVHKSGAIIRHTRPKNVFEDWLSCSTGHLSNLIDILIKPLVNFVRSNLRDITKFLIRLLCKVPTVTILTSFDIKSLYTNIHHDLGIHAMTYW